MFKSLKEKVATQVNKTNQTLFSALLSNDSTSLPRDSGIRTSSTASRDDNENHRSRLSSASSDISQAPITHTNYVSPSRQFIPPSDIEFEHGGDDESDHETNSKMRKLFDIYKNKFTQLKNAYAEVEHEKDNIRNVLQKYQDTSIQQQTKLREQLKLERQAKEQLENSYQQELKFRDHQIEELTHQLTKQTEADEEEMQNLREKITKLETLLTQCKEGIQTHQNKQADLIKERDDLLQQLNETQTMMKDHQSEDATLEVKEHSDSDMSVLLHDKERLHEQLESIRLYAAKLEGDLQLVKQQEQLNEEIQRERDEFKQKYEDLLNLEKSNKEFQEIILQNKQQIEQHIKSFDTLKIEYENLTNELHQTKQAKDNIQALLDQITEERTTYKDKYERTEQQHQQTDDQIDQSKTALTKLQHDYDESLAKYAQLTQTLETQREEHSIEIATLKSQEQIEFDHNFKELREENDRIKSQRENEHQKSLETLKTEHENTQKEQLSALEDELQAAAKRSQDKITELTSQISEHQEEIHRLEQQLKEKDEEFLTYKTNLAEEQNTRYSQLEVQLKNILSDKSELENELDHVRRQMQNTSDQNLQLQQTIEEFETERSSYRNEIETLKSEIISLININEENTRRIDEFDNEKFNFEQEINDKNQQITELDEKIQEIELTLEQTKESGVKLRKALQKTKESINNTEQTNSQDAEIRLQKLTEEYEQRYKQQEIEYNTKLKVMAKEMSAQIDEKERNYNQQLNDFIEKNYKTENDLVNNTEQRIANAEQRAVIAENQMSKMDEQLKEKQLDHYRVVQDLRNQIQTLTKEIPQTTEHFSQTTIEDFNHSSDSQHSLIFEPTEVDYLKQIVLAYMTGTDRITMAKVICAVLRYTDDEKSLIIEQEKLRHSRWLNSSR